MSDFDFTPKKFQALPAHKRRDFLMQLRDNHRLFVKMAKAGIPRLALIEILLYRAAEIDKRKMN